MQSAGLTSGSLNRSFISVYVCTYLYIYIYIHVHKMEDNSQWQWSSLPLPRRTIMCGKPGPEKLLDPTTTCPHKPPVWQHYCRKIRQETKEEAYFVGKFLDNFYYGNCGLWENPTGVSITSNALVCWVTPPVVSPPKKNEFFAALVQLPKSRR